MSQPAKSGPLVHAGARSTPAAPATPDISTWGVFVSSIAQWLIPILALVGLIVLLALGKIASDAALPLIATIVGVHGGVQAAKS